MKIPMFTINISLDDETNEFVPELQKTAEADKYHRRDQVGIIDQCVRVILSQIRSTPKEGE